MGHERGGEARQEREERSREEGRPNRREFLAGSVGALAASRMKNLSAFGSLPREGGAMEKAPTAAAPRRVIIDTDPGVDDALAILLALRSPELQVEAITPVAGNVPLDFTLPNALKLVEIAGRTDVPVAGGARHPLVRKLITGERVHGNNGLAGVEFPEPKIKPVAESAPEMIRKIVKANPGEITIVAVGPLTNVALALRDDQDLAAKIKSIVIMGGSLSGGNVTPAAEFNLYVDPEAARIVFDAGVPLTMVGLDVTRKVLFTDERLKALETAKNPSGIAAAKIMAATLEHLNRGPHPMIEAMHDPLTVANLIDPGILTLKDYYVEVETDGEFTAGETIGWAYGPARGSAPMALADKHEGSPVLATEETFKANARVAMEVDAERFFRLLLGRLTA
ncbi:MAG: nucleoside hydrolase [Candidatus Acidiferrales bacterium]